MPSVATSPAIARGVSAAKVVATIDVPASHQGRVRSAAKVPLCVDGFYFDKELEKCE